MLVYLGTFSTTEPCSSDHDGLMMADVRFGLDGGLKVGWLVMLLCWKKLVGGWVMRCLFDVS